MKANYLPGEVSLSVSDGQLCGLKIDKKKKIFEPPNHRKGWVARIYLLIDYFYGLPLLEEQRILLNQWNKKYPADEEEKKYIAYLNSFYQVGENTLLP
jgi:endonuclease I